MRALCALLLAASAAAAAAATPPHTPGGYGGDASCGDAEVCSGATGNPATFNFEVGGFPAKLLQDAQFGATIQDSPGFLITDPAIVRRAFEARFVDVSSPLFFINILYIDTGADRMLFDVGSGAAPGVGSDISGLLADELRANSIDPGSITKVFLTHGHFDHIAGLYTDANATQPAFPNADVYISRQEWDYWLGDDLMADDSVLSAEDLAGLQAFARNYFALIEDKVTLFDAGAEVVPGVTCVHTPWHTPGHCAYLIELGGDPVLVTGDAIVSVVVGVENPWFRVRFDLRPDDAPLGRYKLLDRAVAERWRVNVMHGAFPALGYVTEDGGTRFRWHEVGGGASPGAVAMCPA